MVQIHKKGFTITFESANDPLSDIDALRDQLLQMLQSDTEACMDERWHVLQLLRQLVPDYKSAEIEEAIRRYRIQNSEQ